MSFFNKLEEKYLISPKILYMVVNLQYYALHQFRSAFSREKFKVSNSDYGKFSGIIMFITFFTNIFIGGQSDKTGMHKKFLFLLTLITTAFFFGFYFQPLMKISSYCFWLCMLGYLIFNNPKQPLLDKIILDNLTNNVSSGGAAVYGKQRLWGTVAYGLATYLCEACLLLNSKKAYDFNNLIYYTVITTVVSAVSIAFLIKNNNRSENTIKSSTSSVSSSNTNEGYSTLLKDPEYMFFIFIMFSNAITRSAMSIYLSIFVREVLDVQPYNLPKSWPIWLKSILGVLNDKPITALTFFGILFEVLVMFLSQGILQKMGFFMPLLLAQLFSLVRFFAYYAIKPKSKHVYAQSCFYELIKGLYFGLAHISAVQIATRLAPSNLRATSQMIYQGTFNALGALVSGLVFGIMFDSKLKGKEEENKMEAFQSLFLINGLISFATILLFVYKYGIKDKVLIDKEKEEAKLNAHTETLSASN